jgi:hypothetical protein
MGLMTPSTWMWIATAADAELTPTSSESASANAPNRFRWDIALHGFARSWVEGVTPLAGVSFQRGLADAEETGRDLFGSGDRTLSGGKDRTSANLFTTNQHATGNDLKGHVARRRPARVGGDVNAISPRLRRLLQDLEASGTCELAGKFARFVPPLVPLDLDRGDGASAEYVGLAKPHEHGANLRTPLAGRGWSENEPRHRGGHRFEEHPPAVLGDELHVVERGGVVDRAPQITRGGFVQIEAHRKLELEGLAFAPLSFGQPDHTGKGERHFRQRHPVDVPVHPEQGVAGPSAVVKPRPAGSSLHGRSGPKVSLAQVRLVAGFEPTRRSSIDIGRLFAELDDDSVT